MKYFATIVIQVDGDDNVWCMFFVTSPWQAKKTAVTTLSQLLDASENVFQTAAATNNSDTFAM